MSNRNRVAKGVPTSGQFAAGSRLESDLSLNSSAGDPTLAIRYGLIQDFETARGVWVETENAIVENPSLSGDNEWTDAQFRRATAIAMLATSPEDRALLEAHPRARHDTEWINAGIRRQHASEAAAQRGIGMALKPVSLTLLCERRPRP